ncbi:MAG: hypothetical protein FWD58_11310 [Firmicutes bacterium]|nr:hypothetical protein [Bacillota bacterium]
MDEKDKRTHVKTLQSLQRDINFYKKSNENNQNPSLEKIIDILRNSQTKLYEALAQHGVTAAEVHKIILENSDKELINEIMRLQGLKNRIDKQLPDPNLSPEKRQSLEKSLVRATQAHIDKWDELINSPNKNDLMRKIEQAQIKQLERENRTKDRTREQEPERTR